MTVTERQIAQAIDLSVDIAPRNPRELTYLANRLDFPDADEFVSHYERHTRTIRNIFEKYIFK